MNILGNGIESYRIVVSDDAVPSVRRAADKLACTVKGLSGIELPIVTDASPEGEYEILIGTSEREKSRKYLKPYSTVKERFADFHVKSCGNTLILNSDDAYGVTDAVNALLAAHFGVGELRAGIISDAPFDVVGKSVNMRHKGLDRLYDNVEQPIEFTADLDPKNGYLAEEDNTSDWHFCGGEYVTRAGEARNLSYIHVYEANASCTVKLKCTEAGASGDMGLMLRYVGKHAYLKAGYDFSKGEWYIEFREGEDFYTFRLAGSKSELILGKEYAVTFVADKRKASLSVDGELLLTAENIRHVTPGRIAVFAKDAALAVSEISAVLHSGTGTLMRGIYHTNLEDGHGSSSTSFVELSDGRVYAHIPGYESPYVCCGGERWEKDTVDRFRVNGFAHPIRLVSGELLQIKHSGEYIHALTSYDDGVTWEFTGNICKKDDPEKGRVINMNDKIMQAPGGRLLFVASVSAENDTKHICEFYFSDDNGKTWERFPITNREIAGLENVNRFAESKMIECADGSLRVYTTWGGMFGCMHYFESADGGKTWGPNILMPEMSAPSSSYQIVRDPYGETDHTYYLIWAYGKAWAKPSIANRSRLALARSFDGKKWDYLGDVWRWEAQYNHHTGGVCLNHMVNPSIGVSRDGLFMACGITERLRPNGEVNLHGETQNHMWVLRRGYIPKGIPMRRFTDLKIGAKYYEAVCDIAEKGIIRETAKNIFNPDAYITAGVFTEALIKAFGCEKAVCKGDTVSVEAACAMLCDYAGENAANGINLAVENGIYECQNGEMKPDAPITRALAATMIYNCMKIMGK